jgi:geranylgeranyl diphosphate synthase type I
MSSPILGLTEFKELFDPLLSTELDAHIARARVSTKDEDLHKLLLQVKKIALAGGKRIRPYAAYLMYRTAGGSDDSVFKILLALEIFHIFALIHDDITDCGELRHGVPTVHAFARSFVQGDPEKAEHLAEGLALLVGDLVFSWSRDIFVTSDVSKETHALFTDMIHAVVLGQMLDVKIMCQTNPSETTILEKTSLKTADYTFIYPFQIGASLAGLHADWAEWCTRMGASLGIAFQLQDDLLDIVGSHHATGKNLLQDIVESQHTIFTAYIRTQGNEKDIQELEEVFGHIVDSESTVRIQELFERSGALAYGKEMISTEITNAKEALAGVTMTDDARSAWETLIATMEKRTA